MVFFRGFCHSLAKRLLPRMCSCQGYQSGASVPRADDEWFRASGFGVKGWLCQVVDAFPRPSFSSKLCDHAGHSMS